MKMFTRILAVVLVLVMALSLAGCGLASKLNGKWEGTVKSNGVSMDVTMEFDKKSGEVEVTMEVLGQEISETSDFEVKGKTLKIEDEEVEYELKGKTLTLKNDGVEFKLEKAKK